MKRALVLVMAGLLLLSFLVACSDNTASGTTDETAASTEQTPANETPDYDPFGKYETPITLTTGRMAINNPNWNPRETIDDNNYYNAYLEELGIDVENVWVVDQTQYDSKLTVSMASEDLPDFFYVSPIMFTQMAEQGLLADLTDVYKYMSEDTKSVLDGIPELLDACKYDGVLMGIPGTALFQTNQLWIREDWRINLGLPEPKTMQDVLEMAVAFTTMDPDGNGKDDTTGFATREEFNNCSSECAMGGFFNSYHSYPRMWIELDNGELAYGSIQPETREALLAMQELYKQGAIDPEFSVKDDVKAYEYVTSGKAGIYYSKVWGASGAWGVRNNFPDAELKGYAIPSIDSEVAKVGTTVPLGGMYVVNKNCKNPEAVMKLVNFYIDLQFTDDLEKMKKFGSETDEDGNQISHQDGAAIQVTDVMHHVRVAEALRNYWSGNEVDLPAATEQWFWFYVDAVKMYTDEGDPASWANYITWGPDNCGGNVLLDYVENNKYLTDKYIGIPTETMASKNSILLDKEKEVFTKIVMGEPIETFDKFVEDWLAMGGEQITQEMNEWYKSANG